MASLWVDWGRSLLLILFKGIVLVFDKSVASSILEDLLSWFREGWLSPLCDYWSLVLADRWLQVAQGSLLFLLWRCLLMHGLAEQDIKVAIIDNFLFFEIIIRLHSLIFIVRLLSLSDFVLPFVLFLFLLIFRFNDSMVSSFALDLFIRVRAWSVSLSPSTSVWLKIVRVVWNFVWVCIECFFTHLSRLSVALNHILLLLFALLINHEVVCIVFTIGHTFIWWLLNWLS